MNNESRLNWSWKSDAKTKKETLSEGSLSSSPVVSSSLTSSSPKESSLSSEDRDTTKDLSKAAADVSKLLSEMKLEWTESVKQRIERELKLKEQKKIKKTQLAEFSPIKPLNKSSSSGTTTSSSNATAEFLARLRRMEMPELRPPSESFYDKRRSGKSREGTTDEVNTSADLLKVKELDSSVQEPSLDVSADLKPETGEISHLTLSSSSSSSTTAETRKKR